MLGVSAQPAPSTQQDWAQVASLGARLRTEPGDTHTRLDLASALITLGLRTLALHELKTLAEQGVPLTEIENHLRRAETLPDDAVPTDSSESILRANLARTGVRAKDFEPAIAEWRTQADSEIRFRAADTNIVRFLKAKGIIDQMQDVRGLFRKMLEQPITELTKRQRGPIVIDGVRPPWILQRLLEDDAQPSVPGFRQQLFIVQHDPVEFCEGLSIVDLTDHLSDDRIRWFVGSDAAEQFSNAVSKRPGIAHSLLTIANPHNASPLIKPIQELLQKFSAQEAERNLERKARIDARYASRDRAYWSERFKQTDSRLRILIPTSRYTTYLRHACADLCDSLESLGHECMLLTEPDQMSLMVNADYLRTIEDFDPDLLISMNHSRGSFNGLLPENLPVLTWIQDAMGHLFTPEQGESIGPLDFVVGMVHRELIERFGFPEEQTRWLPMAAGAAKFSANSPRPQSPREIAYVTHQSESVEAQTDRLLTDFIREVPERAPHFRTLAKRIRTIMDESTSDHLLPKILSATDECIFPDTDPTTLPVLRANVIHGLSIPVAERIFRHQTVQWAADIAKRHGWILRLYGSGWDKHPRFAPFAAGPLEHGDELASCYQNAAVHLHASIQQPMHQRVTECLLSGGLPITRVVRDAFAVMNNQAVLEAIRTNTIEPEFDQQGNQIGGAVHLTDNPPAASMVRTMRSLGLLPEDSYADNKQHWVNKKIEDARRDSLNEAQQINADRFASMTDLFFASEHTLESLLVRTIEDPDWREQTRSRVHASLPDVYTMEGFARSALDFVRARLTAT